MDSLASVFFPLGTILILAFLLLDIVLWPMLGVVGVLLMLIGMMFKDAREKHWFWGLIFISILSLKLISVSVAISLRRVSIINASIVGKSIIEALEQYKSEKGSYPISLDHLVPIHLEEIPHTQMCGHPKFEYGTGKNAPRASEGYELFIYTPLGGINFDVFYYWPSKNYPVRDKGGRIEKIGNWAYVHE